MSNPAKERRGERWYLLTTAATDEAARAGHGEVDVDHVLLALLVSGGVSTRILSLAGLDLAAARTALVDVQQRDLASLGRDDARAATCGAAPLRRRDRRTSLVRSRPAGDQ